MTRFYCSPSHYLGPAVVDMANGALVDVCPDEATGDRIAAALEELVINASLFHALPAWAALRDIEKERVVRYLAKLVRHG